MVLPWQHVLKRSGKPKPAKSARKDTSTSFKRTLPCYLTSPLAVYAKTYSSSSIRDRFSKSAFWPKDYSCITSGAATKLVLWHSDSPFFLYDHFLQCVTFQVTHLSIACLGKPPPPPPLREMVGILTRARWGGQIFPKTPPRERGHGQSAQPRARERPVCLHYRCLVY